MFQQSLKLSEANVLPQGYCKLSNTCTTATSELVTKTALQQQQRPLYRSTCVNQHLQNWRILLVQSFSARMPLQTASSTFRLWRKCWSSQHCYLHCLCTFVTKKCLKIPKCSQQCRKQSGTSVAIFTAVKILWAWLRMNFVSADGDTSSFNPPT